MKKTVLITGAAGNLGRAVTRKFLEEGYHVEASARNREEAQLLGTLGEVNATELNLMDEAETKAFVESLKRRLPSLHSAVLLVGGFAMGSIEDTDAEALMKMYRLNFETAYFMCRPLLSWMKKTGFGRLVLVGARPALDPAAGKNVLAYALSKSLIFRLAEIINEEGKGHDVTASVVVPSIIDTTPNRAAMPDADFSKWATPESIAENIAFICSDRARDQREAIIKMYGNS